MDNFISTIIAAGGGEGFGIKIELILAQVLSFSIVAFILWRFAFKPVLGTMDERQKKISDGLQYAEEMKSRLADAEKQHAEKLQEASVEAARIVNEARENSKNFLEKQTQEAVAKAEDIIKKATEATEQERQKMVAELKSEMAELVVQTTAKVLAKELSEADKTTFSESAAKELYAVNS